MHSLLFTDAVEADSLFQQPNIRSGASVWKQGLCHDVTSNEDSDMMVLRRKQLREIHRK